MVKLTVFEPYHKAQSFEFWKLLIIKDLVIIKNQKQKQKKSLQK